ncbi:hypothetical protein [Flavobacterium sp. XGLA_31]|uniref:hypothetical protein n=1 Tax=Flavobacterium sp. XGLA_31 TaxID=3447666 RepID=UPI003F3302BE
MGLRYYKRVGGNKGFGLNFSGTSISSSYRTKYGSIGSKGFSIRTGIPGLTFRSGYGRGKNKGVTALIILTVIATGFALYYSIVILYNIILFMSWSSTKIINLLKRKYHERKESKLLKVNKILEIEKSEENRRDNNSFMQ